MENKENLDMEMENVQPENEQCETESTEEKIDVVKGIETLENRLIESEKKLEIAQKELDESKDIFQRTLAEYDNYRKRTAKEKAESYNNGLVSAVSGLLPVIDTLEMALNAPCSDENYKKGIELTLTSAHTALEKLGVEEIKALGQVFDPNLHSAVMQESVEGTEPGIVTKQLQKGYKFGDRIIRHSTVAVSC